MSSNLSSHAGDDIYLQLGMHLIYTRGNVIVPGTVNYSLAASLNFVAARLSFHGTGTNGWLPCLRYGTLLSQRFEVSCK